MVTSLERIFEIQNVRPKKDQNQKMPIILYSENETLKC